MKRASFLFILISIPFLGISQQTRTKDLVDSTKSGYQNLDNAGGPKTIGGQLNADNQQREFFFRIPVRVTAPWY
ncbi:MAG: hypothetical protein P8X60_11360, partial [Robiginitalea sp.]